MERVAQDKLIIWQGFLAEVSHTSYPFPLLAFDRAPGIFGRKKHAKTPIVSDAVQEPLLDNDHAGSFQDAARPSVQGSFSDAGATVGSLRRAASQCRKSANRQWWNMHPPPGTDEAPW